MIKSKWIFVNSLIAILCAFFLSACESEISTPLPNTQSLSSPTASIIATLTPLPPTPSITQTPNPTETQESTKTETNTPTLTARPSNTPTETSTNTPKVVSSYFRENAIKIFLTHRGTGGSVACGDSLVAIYIGHLRTGDIEKDIQIAIDTLFSIGQYSGALYNATYPSSLRVGGVIWEKGIANVELGGSYLKPKDACDASRFRAQVWATILQFPEVSRAIPTYNNALLGDLLAVYSDSGK